MILRVRSKIVALRIWSRTTSASGDGSKRCMLSMHERAAAQARQTHSRRLGDAVSAWMEEAMSTNRVCNNAVERPFEGNQPGEDRTRRAVHAQWRRRSGFLMARVWHQAGSYLEKSSTYLRPIGLFQYGYGVFFFSAGCDKRVAGQARVACARH